MRRLWTAVLCAWLCLMAMPALAEQTAGDPPEEVLGHMASNWPAYTLEDYALLEDLPDGRDYGFALLARDGQRILVVYRAREGETMSCWLRTEKAVPQGEGRAWLGRDWDDEDRSANLVEDGGPRYEGETREALIVNFSPDAGEDQTVCYRWRNGAFRLSGYLTPGDTPGSDRLFARVGEGVIEFYPFYSGRSGDNVTTVYGDLQTDLRYASYATFPMSIAAAREKLSVAPKDVVAGEFHAQDVKFSGGRQYPVYLGPGEAYARSADGKGQVSTNGWIQVFGEYDGYIMIQYGISAKRFRVGWIDAGALPGSVDVPALSFANEEQVLLQDCAMTDDPFMSRTAIAQLAAGTQVTALADFGDYFYIETTVDGQTVWGFVPADAITKG